MLRSVNEITGYILEASDGEIGRCKDFLFDDRLWTVRYMVADTGKWLPGRKVLISPVVLEEPGWRGCHFPVKLTRQQVEDNPPLETDAPVSMQHERSLFEHYSWAHPLGLSTQKDEKASQENASSRDRYLRSVKEVMGYHISAVDGDIGHVEDFIVGELTWSLHYVIVDTRNWLPGRKVLIPPIWATSVDWNKQEMGIDLTKDVIKDSPEYHPSVLVSREYEVNLHKYYGRKGYWEQSSTRKFEM
jgi:hypothetical protein